MYRVSKTGTSNFADMKLENYVETVKSITGGLESYDPSPNKRRRFICVGFDLLILRTAFKIEYINFEKFVVDYFTDED